MPAGEMLEASLAPLWRYAEIDKRNIDKGCEQEQCNMQRNAMQG
jgi:hypothetical protein